jgi:ribonuclease H2 subunit A
MEATKGYEWETVRIPEACLGVDIVIGIDEAGRGPVLGSMVYTAAFWPVSEDAEIQKMGFNDSKQLKGGERDRLLDRIRNHPSIGWVIEEISPMKISEVSCN